MHQLIRASRALTLACVVGLLTSVVIARQAQPGGGSPEAAKIKNPVASTPESIAAGKKTYTEFGCNTCHGANGEGGKYAGKKAANDGVGRWHAAVLHEFG